MSSIVDRIRSPLSSAGVYWLVLRLLGAPSVHRHLVTQHARVEAGERVLDIGCGTGRLLDALPEVAYVGLDPSAEYIAAARERYGDRGAFRRADVSSVDLAGDEPFDVAFAVGVMHHLDDREAARLARLAAGSLAPDGRLVTIDPGLTADQPTVARWLAGRDRGARVRGPDGYRRVAEGSFASVEATVRHDLAALPYTHVLLECRAPVGDAGGLPGA